MAREQTLAGIFQSRVSASPAATALISGDREWSYAELNAGANQLAHYLIGLGVGPERTTALIFDRSHFQFLTLIATAKAGAAFLPLDPLLPRERIDFMLADADASVILTVSGLADLVRPADVPVVVVDELSLDGYCECDPEDTDRQAPLSASNAAYIIYTSGSTGTPRGVIVPHTGLSALAAVEAEYLALEEGHRILQFSSITFDAAIEELLIAFRSGAALVLLAEPLVGPDLAELLRAQSITHVQLPPTVLGTLPADPLRTLTRLCVSGEDCPQHLVERWSPGRRMINAYGPSETTVTCTLTEPLSPQEKVTIGRPIPGTRVYVLDSNLAPVPAGTVGELYIAGDCLARGYLGRPGLTASRFVADPYGPPGARMYRSGDLVAEDHAGRLEFVGRADQQVKLRGQRIELGEIESLLTQMADISQAVVVIGSGHDGDPRLVGYLVAAPGAAIDRAAIRRRLARTLPGYMVPSALTVVDTLPRTSSGKLDRKALPPPAYLPPQSTRAPGSALTHQLCGIFANHLRLEWVGPDDNFFELGGHSLLAIRMLSDIRNVTDAELSLAELLGAPTVAAIAEIIEQADAAAPIRRVPRG